MKNYILIIKNGLNVFWRNNNHFKEEDIIGLPIEYNKKIIGVVIKVTDEYIFGEIFYTFVDEVMSSINGESCEVDAVVGFDIWDYN